MKRLAALVSVLVLNATTVLAQSSAPALRDACADDTKKLCADVKPGGGRIVQCLSQNEDKLSQACKDARKALRRQVERKATPAPN